MKRIVSLILALSMVLSMFTMSFAGSSLKDVEGTKYQAAVEALIELGVVSGYPDGTYLPDNVVTRAELAKLLVVAYGLEPAAEASKGVTPFADVNAVANHWASGYINVSADYKFVNGYPDGSFKGDATVTYAEAITMCLRVLGYAKEIESKGTWPTNYIAKAQDLKLMKDIEFKSYNDGAKRGDIALLIWNMLRTPMWEVTGETEGDGLESAPNRYMLNVKFSDYAYTDKATFEGFEIKEDKKEDVAKVYVTWENGRDAQENTNSYDVCKDGEYEYAGNDFYQFVPGTEVEVLVNKEDKTLLTMVVTGSDKLVEGNRDAINDKYELSEIVSKNIIPYTGTLYSLKTTSGTYIADNILTHNCIYSFAGARPDILKEIMNRDDVTVFDLNENYRNGSHILRFASKILYNTDTPDTSVPMRYIEGTVMEIQWDIDKIVDLINRIGDYRDWAILCRTNQQILDISLELNKRKIPSITFKQGDLTKAELSQKMKENKVKILTMHTSKGLEFNNCVVYGQRFYSQEETRLCYVAATRAKNLLVWTKPETRNNYKIRWRFW